MSRYAHLFRGLTVALLALSMPALGCGKNGDGPKGVSGTNSGTFALSYSRLGTAESFGLVGFFRGTAVDTDPFYLEASAGFPDLGDGECQSVNVPDLFDVSGTLDAGEFLSLSTPGGDLQIARTTFNGATIYNGIDPTGTHYGAGASYTLTGDGDPEEVDLGPFSGSWSGAAAVSVTAPDVSDIITIDRFVTLDLQWTPAGSGPLFVHLFQQDASANITHEEICKFSDDGSGSIGSPVLDNFIETLPATFDGIRFMKMSSGSFNVGGLDAPVIVTSIAAVDQGVTFE